MCAMLRVVSLVLAAGIATMTFTHLSIVCTALATAPIRRGHIHDRGKGHLTISVLLDTKQEHDIPNILIHTRISKSCYNPI
jgi:hypothetical protein